MNHLTKLFKIIEITRNQPQYGYNLSGIQKSDLSDLAQHHYLVTFIAWQLALHLKDKGANVDVLKILEISMVHDLGELLGGDISFHYGRAHKVARQAAKAFEKENILFLSKLFGNQSKRFIELTDLERQITPSDEAIVARFADLVECLHYKLTLNKLDARDIEETVADLSKRLEGVKDPVVKTELSAFLKEWSKTLLLEAPTDIIWSLKD